MAERYAQPLQAGSAISFSSLIQNTTGGGGGSGTVTSVSAGTGMSFATITTTGAVSLDTTKVPYLSSGFSSGLLKWNGAAWVFDTSSYITSITSAMITTALGYTPVPNTRNLTINGTTYDLSADRSWSVGDLLSSGSYANPTWLTSLAWSKITGAPSFITSAAISTLTDVTLTSLASGNFLRYNGTAWINVLLSSSDIPSLDMSKITTGSLAWSRITSTPTTISGYGITDAVPSTRTITINGVTQDLSTNRTWTVSSGMTNPMTTLGDIIYGGASGTPTRLGIGSTNTFLQVVAGIPSWFDLFATANTFTALQTISGSVSSGTFSAIVVKNTSGTSSQFVSIELQTASGFYGGLKGFNDGNGGNTGQVLTLYSSKGIVFNTLGRSGAAVANTDPDMAWITSNAVTSMALFSNTASPYARLQLYTANAGNSYTELSFNGAGNITRIKGVSGSSANAGWGLLGHATTDILRWDTTGVYIGGATAPTAFLHLIGSTTAKASLRIASGSTVSSPNDGDIWYDGTNLKMRVGATTKTFTLV